MDEPVLPRWGTQSVRVGPPPRTVDGVDESGIKSAAFPLLDGVRNGRKIALSNVDEDGDYRAVIRDAFVHLEERLRTFGGIDPTAGLSGSKLVDAIFGPAGDGLTRLPAGALLGPVTGGERAGLVHLFKGAFLFARNPTSHRRIEHTADEAHALLQMVDLCLRVISAPR